VCPDYIIQKLLYVGGTKRIRRYFSQGGKRTYEVGGRSRLKSDTWPNEEWDK